MAYENRTVQSSTTNTLPTGTDPLVDNTASGDVQAVKLLDGTAGSTTPVLAGGGVESGALRVTVASDSTGVLSVDDNGAALTVDNGGTFAVQVDGTALTRLTDIETNTDSGAVVGNGAAATAQRVTLANDSTGTVTVTGTATISGTVTANAGTNLNTSALALESGGNLAAAVTALQIIDNIVAGNEAQVDVITLPSIPAGTNNIGDVDILSIAAGDNNIGNVDIVTMPTVTVNAHAVTNAGVFATQVDGAALTALQLIDNTVLVDDAAFTPASSSVNMAGFEADETATDSVDEGDAGAARMTLDRKLITTPQPHTAGGLSIFRSIDLDEGTLEVVKNAPGCIYGMWITNTATTTRWIKFYDATSGTAGTGTPVITFGIPGNSSDDIAGLTAGTHGIMFATGICVGAVTGVADNDTGAPGANDVIINIFYK